jgi:LmbE family N-acetylglucosaminyl deacetylase
VGIATPDEQIESVLVVTAHPDDVDFGVAGSVAAWTATGIEVAYCVITDGDAGGFDPAVPRSEIAGIRRAEQLAAAETVGVHDVTFLGYPDGRLVTSIELRGDISRVIRRVRPGRVVAPSPDRNWERIYASHPDHLAAGDATVSAVYPDARNPFAHPELLEDGYEPHTVRQLWLMAATTRNRFVDVTDTFDKKIAALRCHVSQLPDPEGLEERLRGWLTLSAREASLPEGRLAEGFFEVDTG